MTDNFMTKTNETNSSELNKKEAEIVLQQFSSLQIPTNADDFLEAATLIDSIKRKMKLQIKNEVENWAFCFFHF